jgi:hypothetical protein
MVANVRAAGAASIGLTLYPPYPAGRFKNPQMHSPNSYQNGGDWCWFGGRLIQALMKEGYVAEAYRELRPMVERVKRAGSFHEWSRATISHAAPGNSAVLPVSWAGPSSCSKSGRSTIGAQVLTGTRARGDLELRRTKGSRRKSAAL